MVVVEAHREDSPAVRAIKLEYSAVRALLNRLGPFELDWPYAIRRMESLSDMVGKHFKQVGQEEADGNELDRDE